MFAEKKWRPALGRANVSPPPDTTCLINKWFEMAAYNYNNAVLCCGVKKIPKKIIRFNSKILKSHTCIVSQSESRFAGLRVTSP